MKKATLIVQSKNSGAAVDSLRSLGLLHIEHQQPPKGKEISSLNEDISLLNQAIRILSAAEFSKAEDIKKSREADDWKFIARHIIDSRKRIEQLHEYSRSLSKTISQWEAWGDFSPETIHRLAQEGIYVGLYQIPEKQIKELPRTAVIEKLFVKKGIAGCVVISREKIEIPFKEIPLPKMGLEKMRERLSEDRRTIESIQSDMKKQLSHRASLIRQKKSLQKELEFREAVKGMGYVGDIMFLRGYIPSESADLLLEESRKERWGIVIEEPSPEDRVPTLIRNPRWIAILRPVFKLLEIVPGYREMDISLWFLVFFSVFFGMLIGDAGYGLIYLFIALFARKKWGRKIPEKSIFSLFYLLSFCAIIWGVLSGTFFGQEWLPKLVRPLIPALRESRNVQIICFFLGALHLSIAHLWRAILKLPSLTALAEAGWILILWGAFFLAKLLILGDIFPAFGKPLFITGVISVILFSSLNKNVFKGIGAGLGNLFLNLISNFTDIVSYVRLFAVGLATVAVADAFNKMAFGLGYNGIITGIATSLILLLGHALNILLGPMSVLVHGVRLNVLEFCNHIGIKWSGFSYSPLRK